MLIPILRIKTPIEDSVISKCDTLNMVLFIGCETAYGDTNGRNLPAIVSSQGAEVAVGFSETID